MYQRQAKAPVGDPTTYRMPAKPFAISDDFWIEDGAGRPAFVVDGEAARTHRTLVIKDDGGGERYRVQRRVTWLRTTMVVETPRGSAASVHPVLLRPARRRLAVDLASGPTWKIEGSIEDHEYDIHGPYRKVASISKRQPDAADTYTVEVAPGEDAALVLAVTVVADHLADTAGR